MVYHYNQPVNSCYCCRVWCIYCQTKSRELKNWVIKNMHCFEKNSDKINNIVPSCWVNKQVVSHTAWTGMYNSFCCEEVFFFLLLRILLVRGQRFTTKHLILCWSINLTDSCWWVESEIGAFRFSDSQLCPWSCKSHCWPNLVLQGFKLSRRMLLSSWFAVWGSWRWNCWRLYQGKDYLCYRDEW